MKLQSVSKHLKKDQLGSSYCTRDGEIGLGSVTGANDENNDIITRDYSCGLFPLGISVKYVMQVPNPARLILFFNQHNDVR